MRNAGRCCILPELTQRESLWLWLGEVVQCKWIMLLGLAEMITEGTNMHGQQEDRIIHDKALDSFTSITEYDKQWSYCEYCSLELGVMKWLMLGQGLTVGILVVISRYVHDVRARGRVRALWVSHLTVSCRKLLKELDKKFGHMMNVYIILMWKVYRGIGWCRHKLECSILMNQPFQWWSEPE